MTRAVGQTNSNPFGLHEMHGNVWEWVNDWWKPGYYEQFVDNAAINPQGWPFPESQRVIRGGSWDSSVLWCRSTYRIALAPDMKIYSVGFRIALSIEAVEESLKQQVATTTPKIGPRDRQGIDSNVKFSPAGLAKAP